MNLVIGDPGCSTCLGFGIVKKKYPNGGYTGETFICGCAITQFDEDAFVDLFMNLITSHQEPDFANLIN